MDSKNIYMKIIHKIPKHLIIEFLCLEDQLLQEKLFVTNINKVKTKKVITANTLARCYRK